MTARVERAVFEGRNRPDGPQSFDELYQAQWWPMLRLATGLVDHTSVAEDVVQDAFAAVYVRWDAIREPAAVIGYLRTCVINGSRNALRKRITARKYLSLVGDASQTAEAADHTTMLSAEHQLVRAALTELPRRQREVLTLRYLCELSDSDIAEATGLSEGGVRSAASRGLAVLRGNLGGQL